MPFDMGNVFKYMTRMNSKGQRQDDIMKIYYYATCALSSMQYGDIFNVYYQAYSRSRFLLMKFKPIFKENGFDISFGPDEWHLKDMLSTIQAQAKKLILN